MTTTMQMMAPTLPLKGGLEAGRDLYVIACEREGRERCIGVRWASRGEWGFPSTGYTVERIASVGGAGGDTSISNLGTFCLPASSDWDAFERDARARTPACGAYFPAITESTLGFLLPLVRCADLRTPESERPTLTRAAATIFGNSHENDAELAWQLWRQAPVPALTDLLSDVRASELLFVYYWRQCSNFLLTLALRFEYAVLLGLATSDAKAPATSTVRYRVSTQIGAVTGSAESEPVAPGTVCMPAPPAWAKAMRVPGTVQHPALTLWPQWTPPTGFGPTTPDGRPLPNDNLIPRAPATYSGLSWAPPPAETTLIGHGPVLYQIARYDHGAASAAGSAAPALPANAVFTPVLDGELVTRSQNEPHFTDLPGMTWPPLEGWYDYEIRGVDLLGTLSAPAPRVTIRHADDIAPPMPGARVLTGQTLAVPDHDQSARLRLAIDWLAAHDFGGPDAQEFRIAASWIPRQIVGVKVTGVVSTSLTQCRVDISGWVGAENAWQGGLLCTPGHDFPIVSNTAGSPATLMVRKLNGLMPALQDAALHGVAPPSALTRVARLARKPVCPATVVSLNASNPVELTLAEQGGVALPITSQAGIYLQLLRVSLSARRLASDRWQVEAPSADSEAAAVWQRWLTSADPGTAIVGSPALLFEPHELDVDVALPGGFDSGLLLLQVTASDLKPYVQSAALPAQDPALANALGNESRGYEAMVSVRSLKPPGQPGVTSFDPNSRLWARSATKYREFAEYELGWQTATDAARYEVWRLMEGALSQLAPGASDAALRAAASQPDAVFELRSDQVFGLRYTDRLPGLAPTRALYKVRSVGNSGEKGAFSALIGPVHVPDVRPPPQPNLLKVAIVPTSEQDRAIAVEWSQPGPLDGVRFDIFVLDASLSGTLPMLAGQVPPGTAPDTGRRFRFVHPDRVPGKPVAYSVQAVRVAPDPVDPVGVLMREIRGPATETREVRAVSAAGIVAPTTLAAQVDPSGAIVLTWMNRDVYRTIEIWQRASTKYVYQRVAVVGGQLTSAQVASPGPGTWEYQLRAKGYVGEGRSAPDLEVIFT